MRKGEVKRGPAYTRLVEISGHLEVLGGVLRI